MYGHCRGPFDAKLPITDAFLIHGHWLEELEILAAGGQVHHLIHLPRTALFRLSPSCCTLHSSCSTNVFFGQTCQIKPFGILCRTLRVTLQEWVVCQCTNAERLYFRPRLCERQRDRVVVLLL